MIRGIQIACFIFVYLLRLTAASSINGQRNVDEPSSHAPEEYWSTGVSKTAAIRLVRTFAQQSAIQRFRSRIFGSGASIPD
jgi:hypothetical protein